MTVPSIYTPEGAFLHILVVLALALAAAVGYLLVFTGAGVPL